MKKLVGVIALAFLFTACSHSTVRKMETSTVVPGAQGELTVSGADNNNQKLVLEVKHLANPSALPSGSSNYVVWARPFTAASEAQNLGALSVDDNLTGKLETITPFPQFSLFITAESSPTVTKPTGDPLLWTNVSRSAE